MGAGVRKPKNRTPGTDLAGRVEAVGKNVTKFRSGDEVFGESVKGHQWHNGGAFAEYVSVPENTLALKPTNLTFEHAAAIPTSGLIALDNLRGRVQPGNKVLINGAGGGVGTLAVQLAKSYGADVTAVDTAEKLDMLLSIGADRAIDYTREDFTEDGLLYDLMFDVVGNRSVSDCRGALTTEGTYVLIGHDRFGASGARWIGSMSRFLRLLLLSPFVSQRMAPRVLKGTRDPLDVLGELLEEGTIIPIIDKTYPLREVPDAIRYLEEGRALGKIIITI